MLLQCASQNRDSDHDALVRRQFPYMGTFIAAFVALDVASVVLVLVAL